MEDEALYNQWKNFSTSEQWDRARQVLGQMLAREPDSPWIHYQLGDVCYNLGDYEPSLHHFREAIKFDPDDDDSYRGIAHTFLAMGRAGSADDHARVALRINPDHFGNWTLMAHLCLHFEDKKQAALCIERAATFAPESTSVLSLRAQLNRMEGSNSREDVERSLLDYQEILAKDPEHETALYKSGLIHLNQTKDYQKAEQFFRGALAQDPTDKDYQTALIQTHRKRDPILKLLWAPINKGRDWLNQRWFWLLAVLFLLATKQVGFAIIFAAFLSYFVVYWPPVKLYELLTLAEAHKQLGTLAIYRGPIGKFHRLSYRSRFVVFFFMVLSFWATLAAFWNYQEVNSPLLLFTSIILIGAYLLLVILGIGLNVFASLKQAQRVHQHKGIIIPPPSD